MSNRFKNKMSKEKAKEIVGSNTIKENTIEIETKETNIPPSSAPTDEPVKEEVVKENITKEEEHSSSSPKKTIITAKKIPMVKFGVSIREDNKKKIDKLAKKSKIKPNETVIAVLEEVFDGKSFNVTIEKKQNIKVTSYNIPENMYNAIDKISENTGVNKSEIFNRILEEGLKNFFE